MGQITWRNVDSPSFAGVGESIRTASTLLGSATDKLSDSIGAFKDSATQDASNEIMARALRYQDPTAYRDALANGSLLTGIDPSAVSQQTMSSLDTRAGSLLDQATKQDALDTARYKQNRLEDINAKLDAAAPAFAELSAAYQSGNPALIRQVTAKHNAMLGGLPTEELLKKVKELQGLETSTVGNNYNRSATAINGQNLHNAAYKQTRLERDNALRDAAGPAMYAVGVAHASGDATKIAEANAKYGDILKTLPAEDIPEFITKTQGYETAGLKNEDSRFNSNVLRTDYADTQTANDVIANVRRSSLNNGDVIKNVEPILDDLSVGARQKVLAELDRRYPGAYSGGSVLPTAGSAGAGVGLTSKGGTTPATDTAPSGDTGINYDDSTGSYSSSIPAAYQAKITVARDLANTRAMENKTASGSPTYAQELTEDKPAFQVADELFKTAFKDRNQPWVLKRVHEVMKRAGVSAPVAGGMLKNAITTNAFNNVDIDSRMLDATINDYKVGNTTETALRDQGIKNAVKQLTDAEATYKAAQAELINIKRLIENGQKGLIPRLKSREEKVIAAQALLDRSLDAILKHPDTMLPRNQNKKPTKTPNGVQATPHIYGIGNPNIIR